VKKGGDHHRWWRVRLLLCIAEGGRNYRNVKCAQKFKKIIVIIIWYGTIFFYIWYHTDTGEVRAVVLCELVVPGFVKLFVKATKVTLTYFYV
jgi:hypothetical protein